MASKNMKKTKIVCTISDFNCEEDFLRKLFFSGMNVVRMNTAHATEEGMKKIIRNVRAVSPHLGLLIDTKGPEIRTTAVAAPIFYKCGDVVKIFGRPDIETTHDIINLSYSDITKDVKVGDHILFDDGTLDMLVLENTGPMLVAQVQNDGFLGSRKSVNIPGEHIDLPSITEKDRRNILFAIEQKIDFIAHSFVRNAADVKAVQDVLDEHKSPIKIISKIENQEGIDNIDEIIDASYGIMIARGDLGIEIPLEEIPGIQRQITRKCISKRKPVIVATQMLHSMITSPRPTRAEVTDIANAIYSHADALMLSGETASGKYPVEAVQTMTKIAQEVEMDPVLRDYITPYEKGCETLREFLAHSAIESSRRIDVKGILTDSETGETARILSSFRGPTPILAICYREQTQRWLNLSYGIMPVYQKEHSGNEYVFTASLRMLRQKGYIGLDDKIAYLSGCFGEGGGTTLLEINKVRQVFENQLGFHLPDYSTVYEKIK